MLEALLDDSKRIAIMAVFERVNEILSPCCLKRNDLGPGLDPVQVVGPELSHIAKYFSAIL